MRRKVNFVCAGTLITALSTYAAGGAEFAVSPEDLAGYRIVMPESADASTMSVALDVADILRESTGVLFPVIMDNIPANGREIIVGADNGRLPALDLAGLGGEFVPGEYEIRAAGRNLVIVGGPPRGDINGMYGLCQDHLGCLWVTPGCQHIPRRQGLRLEGLPDRQRPAFRYRSTCAAMQWDPDWCVRNRLSESKERCGGPRPSSIFQLRSDLRTATMANSWNPHAFQDIPASLYEDHPDWFMMTDGKRVLRENPVQQAYCITNPGFTRWVAAWTRQRLRDNPGMEFVSITASDSGNHCSCKACEEAYRRVGISGAYMEFANQVAEDVVTEFPAASIIAFAYAHTFEPNPVKLHPNVRIIWAPISADCAHALDEGGPNRDRDFAGQLAKWQANTRHLGVWYYQDTLDAPMPRPSLYPTRGSLRLFRDHGVDQVFIEMYFNCCRKTTFGTDGDKSMPAYGAVPGYYTRSDDNVSWVFPFALEHLHAYIFTRLLWDADFDVDQGVRDFCRTYYGAAGDEIAAYALTVEDLSAYERSATGAFEEYKGIHMGLSYGPELKLPVMEELDARFARALEAVRADATLRRRVEMARMSVDLSLLVHAPEDHPLRQPAFERFFGLVEEIGLDTHLRVVGIGHASIPELKEHLRPRS